MVINRDYVKVRLRHEAVAEAYLGEDVSPNQIYAVRRSSASTPILESLTSTYQKRLLRCLWWCPNLRIFQGRSRMILFYQYLEPVAENYKPSIVNYLAVVQVLLRVMPELKWWILFLKCVDFSGKCVWNDGVFSYKNINGAGSRYTS